MAITREKVQNRIDDLKRGLAAIDTKLKEFREAIAESVGITDPLVQNHIFEQYSDLLEVSARLSVYSAAPLNRVGDMEKYFSERSGVYDLMLHGIPPSKGISNSRDLIKMAYFLSARNECEIWKFSGNSIF